MNEGVKDPDQKSLKKRVAKETSKKEDTTKVPAKVDVTKQGTKKRKGGHIKMLARKRKRPQSDVDSDNEHIKCLKIVTFEGTMDSEIMERKSVIARLNKVSSPDGDYLVIYRANGNFRAFNCLLENWENSYLEMYELMEFYLQNLKMDIIIYLLRHPKIGERDIGMEIRRWKAKDVDEDGKCLKIRSRCVKVFGYILQELKKINMKKHEVKQVQQSCLGENYWEIYIPDLSTFRCKSVITDARFEFIHWDQRLKNALNQGTTIMLYNVDPDFTSTDIENRWIRNFSALYARTSILMMITRTDEALQHEVKKGGAASGVANMTCKGVDGLVVWRQRDGVGCGNNHGGDGGGCMVAAAIGDESEKGVSWWDGADVMGTTVERE
ncbi:hypothetical protein Tco_0271855 [Tanacetum coccineum]